MEFKDKLQALRKQKQLTQEELAQELFVSRTAISKWESGRGMPSIDSLKEISRLFEISIDDLLSSEELMEAAENQVQEKTKNICNLVLGIMDCMMFLLLFLPLFGERSGEVYLAVAVLSLSNISVYLKWGYIAFAVVGVLFGIVELALQSSENSIWCKNRFIISLCITFFGSALFILSRQPYAAVFLLGVLGLKAFLLIKGQ